MEKYQPHLTTLAISSIIAVSTITTATPAFSAIWVDAPASSLLSQDNISGQGPSSAVSSTINANQFLITIMLQPLGTILRVSCSGGLNHGQE